MKSVSRFAMVATLGAVLVGCGKPVEVPTANVGNIMGTSGYQEAERAKRFEELTNYKED